jgi:hypothetical protein
MAQVLTYVEEIQIREKAAAIVMMHRQFCYRAADAVLPNELNEAILELDILGLYLFDLTLSQCKSRGAAYKMELKRKVVDGWATQMQMTAEAATQRTHGLTGKIIAKSMRLSGMGGRIIMKELEQSTQKYNECFAMCSNSAEFQIFPPVEIACTICKNKLLAYARQHSITTPVIDETKLFPIGIEFMEDISKML